MENLFKKNSSTDWTPLDTPSRGPCNTMLPFDLTEPARLIILVATNASLPGEQDMAKKQTRRSISIRGEIYDMVKRYCDAHGISMSAFVEERILEFLGEPSKPGSSPTELNEEISQHFTF